MPESEAVQTVDHPLATLGGDEITAAVAVARSTGHLVESARFAYIGLHEPSKEEVRAFVPGGPIDRQVRLVIVTGPESDLVEAVVSVTDGTVRSWQVVEDARPALLIEESMGAINALRENPDWQAAMRRRGITDFESVQIDPWPAGSIRARPRGGPPDLPLPVLLAGGAGRQRLRPPGRGGHRLRRHGPRRGA